jgi:hypothetical protein
MSDCICTNPEGGVLVFVGTLILKSYCPAGQRKMAVSKVVKTEVMAARAMEACSGHFLSRTSIFLSFSPSLVPSFLPSFSFLTRVCVVILVLVLVLVILIIFIIFIIFTIFIVFLLLIIIIMIMSIGILISISIKLTLSGLAGNPHTYSVSSGWMVSVIEIETETE